MTNEMLREWGMDRISAGKVLRDLVADGFAVKEGGRRYATYSLSEDLEEPIGDVSDSAPGSGESLVDRIVAALRARGAMSAKELADLLGVHRNTALRALNDGIEQGRVGVEGAARSPSRRYVPTLLS